MKFRRSARQDDGGCAIAGDRRRWDTWNWPYEHLVLPGSVLSDDRVRLIPLASTVVDHPAQQAQPRSLELRHPLLSQIGSGQNDQFLVHVPVVVVASPRLLGH